MTYKGAHAHEGVGAEGLGRSAVCDADRARPGRRCSWPTAARRCHNIKGVGAPGTGGPNLTNEGTKGQPPRVRSDELPEGPAGRTSCPNFTTFTARAVRRSSGRSSAGSAPSTSERPTEGLSALSGGVQRGPGRARRPATIGDGDARLPRDHRSERGHLRRPDARAPSPRAGCEVGLCVSELGRPRHQPRDPRGRARARPTTRPCVVGALRRPLRRRPRARSTVLGLQRPDRAVRLRLVARRRRRSSRPAPVSTLASIAHGTGAQPHPPLRRRDAQGATPPRAGAARDAAQPDPPREHGCASPAPGRS